MGIDNTGLLGIEHMLDQQLSGNTYNKNNLRDARGASIVTSSLSASPEKQGLNIILTIDHAIQEITEEALERGINKSKAKKGFVIVSDPHSGKILALANYPFFNPNKTKNLNLKNTKKSCCISTF